MEIVMTPATLLRRQMDAAIEEATDRAQAEPTVWGRRDCALWCADVLKEFLGYDPAVSFRGRYTTPRGYLRVLRNMGYASLEDAIRSVALVKGWKQIDPAEAQPGDVGLTLQQRGIYGALLYWRAGFWVGHRDHGYVTKVSGDIKTAFNVI